MSSVLVSFISLKMVHPDLVLFFLKWLLYIFATCVNYNFLFYACVKPAVCFTFLSMYSPVLL